MKKIRDILRSPVTTIAAFGLAAGLLLYSSIGGARAALTYFSETYSSRYGMYDIGVTLVEQNGDKSRDVSHRNYVPNQDNKWDATNSTYQLPQYRWREDPEVMGDLFSAMLVKGEDFVPGKVYDEALAVRNSGSNNGVDEYVRVTIYRYWVDAKGNRMRSLAPDLIDLKLANLDTDWLIDENASTKERTVLYYNKRLPKGSTTKPFCESVTIDKEFATTVTQTSKTVNGGTEITTSYVYNGVKFNLYIVVDAVQDHNAQSAIKSAWGRNVAVNEDAGTLRLR